mmetsp:Transcript_77977/g.252402  ORF Transcript_77977/g.252402 Transcript_77977/m.252402 type:complete len:207 (+) Transcript_77977:44-664(+)
MPASTTGRAPRLLLASTLPAMCPASSTARFETTWCFANALLAGSSAPISFLASMKLVSLGASISRQLASGVCMAHLLRESQIRWFSSPPPGTPSVSWKQSSCSGRDGDGGARTASRQRAIGRASPASGSPVAGALGLHSASWSPWKAVKKRRTRVRLSPVILAGLGFGDGSPGWWFPGATLSRSSQITSRRSGHQWRAKSSKSAGA